jgi:hypothetical protein
MSPRYFLLVHTGEFLSHSLPRSAMFFWTCKWTNSLLFGPVKAQGFGGLIQCKALICNLICSVNVCGYLGEVKVKKIYVLMVIAYVCTYASTPVFLHSYIAKLLFSCTAFRTSHSFLIRVPALPLRRGHPGRRSGWAAKGGARSGWGSTCTLFGLKILKMKLVITIASGTEDLGSDPTGVQGAKV